MAPVPEGTVQGPGAAHGPALLLRFHTGRYHARPWGTAPPEQRIEWPPSPWRITRALADVAFRRGRQACLGDLVAWLATHDWSYTLPAVTQQTISTYNLPTPAQLAAKNVGNRYVQLEARKRLGHTDQKARSTMVVDTHALMGPGRRDREVWVHLPPGDPQRLGDLRDLASGLTWLGRAETWVTARVVDDPPLPPNCVPVEGTAPGAELRTTLCLDPGLTIDQLCTTVFAARRRGPVPSGARHVAYSQPPPPALRPPDGAAVTEGLRALRVGLAQAQVPLTGTWRLTDALWGVMRRRDEPYARPPMLPVPDPQRPTRMRDVIVWWPDGDGPAAYARRLNEAGPIEVPGHYAPVPVHVLAVSTATEPVDAGTGIALDPLLGPSDRWVSVLPTRTCMSFDVQGWAAAAGLPVAGLHPVSEHQRARAGLPHWSDFMALRPSGPERQRPLGMGWRLELTVPVPGPVALGTAADLSRGFGVFLPERRSA